MSSYPVRLLHVDITTYSNSWAYETFEYSTLVHFHGSPTHPTLITIILTRSEHIITRKIY